MSLILTRTQNMREMSNIDKNEYRWSQYGGLDLFMTQSNQAGGILTPAIKAAAERSVGSILETPVIDFNGGVTIGNARSLTIADSELTSRMVQLNFATYTFGFTQVPSLFLNNETGAQEDFNKKLQACLFKLASTLDTAALAALTANKNRVFNNALGYTVTGNVLQVPFTDRELIIGDISGIMSANDYFAPLHFVGNAGLTSIINRLKQFGANNSQDKSNEYMGKMLHISNGLANEAGVYASVFAVEQGQIGMLFRFDREALAGRVMADGTEWNITTLPMLDVPCGTYYYEGKGDNSAIAGAASADMTVSYKQYFGYSVDIAFMTPYNSDTVTRPNPITKFNILAKV